MHFAPPIPRQTDNTSPPRESAPADSGRTLIITCTDRAVSPVLDRGLVGDSRHVLMTPGATVRPFYEADARWIATVERPILRREVARIVICGHSGCKVLGPSDEPACREATFGGAGMQSGTGWYQRVCRRMADATLQNRRATAHVRAQLDHLRTYPAVADALRRGELRLDGLFYLCESGSLLALDPTTGLFLPPDGVGTPASGATAVGLSAS